MINVHKIENLLKLDITDLLEQSQIEGFRFVNRLLTDYQTRINTFNKPGEALYGVFTTDKTLIAIGGVNIDPFLGDPTIARLRRFYVLPEYRRKGVGTILLEKLLQEAKQNFCLLVLHTDTEQADQFYTSFGFTKVDDGPNYTHELKVGD
ncbi:GNAT family N-acetyltransferase [Anaerobacillus alkaliphilus]|uniref:GNAT family N-acetyltransferase n=1 Tax=Anaerobacillus alkaliphilus TaxID=1548597 RepID=A0A4Q0VWA6_9BACI|nr:GNAT family N-acetyltransferase [Anaerobacillus alkaliphilus]RXJ02431.1 GNAT family N-acetyltransferase [Anaerobacillus alkaliphilus]